jgi:spore germination cell wall hydrolase CwlJ-like protein
MKKRIVLTVLITLLSVSLVRSLTLSSTELSPEEKRILYNILFAEVGGGVPEELLAVASTLLNRLDKKEFEKVVKGFSSYTTNSKQYQKAAMGDLNPYEKKVFQRNALLFDQLMSGELERGPWTHFENVNTFGEPYWAKGQQNFKDIGRQRFYTINENPQVQALGGK